jgi:hypothetical protein
MTLQQPPNKRALAMSIINEVEPFAASLRSVFRLSSKVATNRNAASGHQPGKGSRTDHTATPQTADATVTIPTKV